MPRTLLTGANSFVGAHVINSLIAAGYDVVGTVRRENLTSEILALHPEWKEKLELIVVKNYADESVWDHVFETYQLDHIVHVAAPLVDIPGETDYDRDFLTPNVENNLALLRSAKRIAPTVKSVAVTGSINALTTGSPEELLAGPITNETWLPITREQAREVNNNYISYCSGKKEGELALWDFVKAEKPPFSVTVFLPALIFGPPLQPIKDLRSSLNYSTNVIYSFFNGTHETIPATSFPSFVDVRDLADAHVKALTTPAAANRRLLVNGKPMTYTSLVHALAEAIPELEGRLPADSGEDAKVTPARIEAEADNELLGLKFRTVEETMADTARRILELEKLET
ncbi:hypothetical protein B0T26DRAFT_802653 [Lasiosphaeria miniovina]|uniref:NAD-dependent epimerase/dehydratase domain-containing protein n=1 Tax=Lasiosphaeria miniovina TaxID=1954250 RepID=A0AA40AKK7_9PEZI|nr:uncharacterized protein B0T26DRAFT_802653 [Lasiosphaeria miniovina]KAK0717553.1 hypothetical protein B0T26DRAFT_802653 [Lasiosphaeria miniovina]